ncbi:hypothetical protein JCM8208_006599 [Rhodotorula glutinis]
MQQPDTGQRHPPAPDYYNHDLAHLRANPTRTAHPLHHPGQAPPPPPPPHHLARPTMATSYSTTHALAQQRQQYAHPQQQQQQQHPLQFYPQVQHAPPPQQDSRTQLFVSNLPFRARWQDLKDLMRKCGTVLRADVALNPTDGRSRGFGVVLFAKADDAHKAIATYHGYTWQTRVLDVRIDAQDPTGALALAEANRQQAIQNQHKLLEQQRARNSPVPPPPPPPGGLPYGAMLVPVPGVPGQAYLAAPPPPPPSSAPGSESSPSPYLSPAVVRTNSQDHHPSSRRSPSPARAPSGPPSSASPASTLATPTDLSPGAAATADPLLALGKRVTPPHSAPRSPTLHSPAPPWHHEHHPQQADSGPHGYPSQGPGQGARGQDVPPQLQHALALVPPPPPPPMPMQVQVQLGHHHQPMLVPMVSVHPMGYAVPGGLVGYYAAAPQPQQHQGPARPGSAPPHLMHPHGGAPGGGGPGGPGYQNRHLFVGNLPFNCQWQELKDLMRGAGSVLRADIAQGPDGRSRGFGSVLFGTSQDAERAVGMFNGFEFNGRTLKVHFDKFSGAAVNNPQHPHGPPPPPPPPHQHQPHYGGHHGPPPPPPPPYNRQHQPFAPPGPIPYRPQTLEHLVSQQQHSTPNGPSPLSGLAHSVNGEQDYPSRPGTATTRPGSSDDRSAQSPPAPSSASQQAPSSPALSPLPDASQGVTAPLPSTTSPPVPSFVRGHSNPAAPSRIAMPPPLPFSLASLGHPSSAANGAPHSAGSPFSPMRTAGLPPMTPSMPAFTFGGAGPFAAQMTPPLLPHGMFSPGVGPFSPGTPGGAGGGGGGGGGPMSPFFGPGGAWGHTVAPGQQTPGGFNPMFPAYPYTPGHHLPPHAMQQHQYAAMPQHASFPEEHELEHAHAYAHAHAHEQPHAVAVGDDSTYGESSPEKTPQANEPSYFPPVVPPSQAESAPMLSATSASAPPLSPTLGAPDVEAAVAGGRPKSEGAGASGPLERAMDALSVNGGGGGGAGGGTRSLHSSPRMTAPQVVAPQPVHPPPVPEVGWAEGSPPPPVEKELAPVAAGATATATATGARRASLDGSGGGKPAFGTSIWG